MSTEVSLTITKILNWTRTDHNARVEVAFYGLQTGTYLAHKTALGYYSHQSLLLNTSFKIHFTRTDHVVSISRLSSTAKYLFCKAARLLS